PGVALLFVLLAWIRKRHVKANDSREDASGDADFPSFGRALLVFGGVLLLSMWTLSIFDFSRPAMPHEWKEQNRLAPKLLSWQMPMGVYVSSICQAIDHGRRGHTGFLFGETRSHGWLYYFPVTAWYKVPIGIAIVLLLGLLSLRRVRPRWDEIYLLIPAIIWFVYLVVSGINIGFRHLFPAYVFLIF